MSDDDDRAASQWLVSTIRRSAQLTRRHFRRKLPEEPTDPDDPLMAHALAAVDHIDEQLFVEDLLGQLSQQERSVIVLSVLQDMTQSEIATTLRVSQPRVSRIRHGAIRKLRTMLKGDVHDGTP